MGACSADAVSSRGHFEVNLKGAKNVVSKMIFTREKCKKKGWLTIANIKLTFTFLVWDFEYGKIPTKESESWF